MNTLAKYSFLPWLRQGLSNSIKMKPVEKAQRASIDVSVKLITDTEEQATIKKTIKLIGSGDIIGISPDAIIKFHPRDWITDHEPNYVPFIEFYDEDFPWRYSPMPPESSSLRTTSIITPWLTLVVLKEVEFTDSEEILGPLPYIETTKDAVNVFPIISQLWAWAHVHVNMDLKMDDKGNDLSLEESIKELEVNLMGNPDIGYSRLICPRKLEPNTAYHAFLIPTFETGRRAGLGKDIGGAKALDIAWGNNQTRFPYFFRWYFRTSERGDFEYLVRLLKPRKIDERVGIRDMDVSDPGGGVDGIDMGDENPQVIGMEGALKSPQTKSTVWPRKGIYPEDFQKQLADYINKACEYQKKNPDTDPIVTPPLYGRWHALKQKLSVKKGSRRNPYDRKARWLTELNLDPRHRATAGLGTRVIQKNQEEYVNRAWEQIGNVNEANQRLMRAQLSECVSFQLYCKHLEPLDENLILSLTSSVQNRVLDQDTKKTVSKRIRESRVPPVIVSPEFRKTTRPRGALSTRIQPEAKRRFQTDLITRINKGKITATPPKTTPEEIITLDKIAQELVPEGMPRWFQKILSWKWFKWIPVILEVIPLTLLYVYGINAVNGTVLGAIIALLLGLALILRKWSKAVEVSNSIREENLTPEFVDDLPTSSEFQITELNDQIMFQTGGEDTEEAENFKEALRDLISIFSEVPEQPSTQPELDVHNLVGQVMTSINPKVCVKNRLFRTLVLPEGIFATMQEKIVPVMAYPEFPHPMYEPLRDMSTELLIPNINLIPQNTISLLITNQKFIESYMVGLNHEMGRELLWREYPTDQRGSYFRQFWDVRNFISKNPSLTEKDLAEKLKDIPEIHKWFNRTELASHNHRESGGDTVQVVLLIRGDILKKYPQTVVYAHRAQWKKDDNGNILKGKKRTLAPTETDEERDNNERHPQYTAQVKPDIYFIGFDLTIEEAEGDEEDPGWFFVLKERPGEPRFGLDMEDESVDIKLSEWDDMSWKDVKITNNHIDLSKAVVPSNPSDVDVEWNINSDAADIAYILFQDPVLVAVHAKEMLGDLKK